MNYISPRLVIIARPTKWGWHFRFRYKGVSLGYNRTFGWHVKMGSFVRARTR